MAAGLARVIDLPPAPVNNKLKPTRERKWLTVDQVAGELGVSRATVYRMVGDARLKAIKHAGRWRFRPSEIANYFSRLEGDS